MSSLDQNADFKITATWEDNATGPMVSSTQKINLAWKQVRDEQRAVTREFEINNRTLVASTRVIRSVTSVLRTGVGLWQTWTLMQIRAQDSAKNLREAQGNLQDVFTEFGPNSKEYINALKDVKDAQEDLDRTTKDNLLGTMLLIATAVSSITTAAVSAIPKVRQLAAIVTKTKIGTTVPTSVTGTPASQGPALPISSAAKPTAGSGPPGGFGGLGLIGPVALGLNIMEQILDFVGVKKQSGRTDVGFGKLNQIQEILDQGSSGQVIININSPTPNQMVTDIANATKRASAFIAN